MSILNKILSKSGNSTGDVAITGGAPGGQAATQGAVPVLPDKGLKEIISRVEPGKGELSIDELLKNADLDADEATKRSLAEELSCPTSILDDIHARDYWLRVEVMRRL